MQLSMIDAVDQNQVWFNVAVAATGVFSFERMVAKRCWEWLLFTEKFKNSLNLGSALSSAQGQLVVTDKLSLEDWRKHGF